MDTNLCIIQLGEGERVGDTLGKVLDTPDMTTIGAFVVSKENPTELHYHDFDEYWYFTEGTTTVTLRTADGQSESYRVGPGDLYPINAICSVRSPCLTLLTLSENFESR